MEPPSMLEYHPMQGRSLPDPLAWERDPGTWTQPTRRTESASSTHRVISALTASYSIGVITSTIDLLSGNAQVRGGVGGTYRSLLRDDLCEVWRRQPPRWRVTGVKSEASSRRRVKPRRICSSADMSGQATTKSGRVPLRAMTCGCEGQPLTALSHERTGDRTVHWARLLWVAAVRIFGEPARLSIGE